MCGYLKDFTDQCYIYTHKLSFIIHNCDLALTIDYFVNSKLLLLTYLQTIALMHYVTRYFKI